MKIVIIGAGVSGAILARRLARMPGVELHCLERVGPDDHSEAGTGLNVGPNAIKALRITDPELCGAVEAASLPWQRWRTALTDGTVLFDLPLSQVADNPGIRIRWSQLYRVLRDAAGPAIRYGCEIEAIGPDDRDATKSAVRWSQDGRAHTLEDIDLLIGADGRYSCTREAFSGLPTPRHVGVAIGRTLVPDTSGGLIDDYGQWFNGAHRLLAFRVPPDHIYIAATYPVAAGEPLRDEWKTESVMRRCYEPANSPPCAEARWLINAMCANLGDSHWARMQQSEIRYCEPGSNVMYLGDSAHGMAPTLGQGATQAVEDACVAAQIIEAGMAAGQHDPRGWLQRMEAARSERMRFVMALSIAATDTMLEGAEPVSGTRWKAQPGFLGDLRTLYREVPLPIRTFGPIGPNETFVASAAAA